MDRVSQPRFFLVRSVRWWSVVLCVECRICCFFFFQAEDGIRDYKVTGVQTCALPILPAPSRFRRVRLPKRSVRIGVYVALILITLGINYWAAHKATEVQRVRIPYSPFFLAQVKAGNVAQITSKGSAIQGVFRRPTHAPAGGTSATRFDTEIPAFADTAGLSRLLQSEGVVVNAEPLDTGGPWWQNLLLGFGPTILFLLLLFWLMRRAGNVQNMLGSFGRSRARRYQPSGDRVTFADVAGIDEAKAELTEVVDFLRKPDKYVRLGGHLSHRVLLSGPPGTGENLLAPDAD